MTLNTHQINIHVKYLTREYPCKSIEYLSQLTNYKKLWKKVVKREVDGCKYRIFVTTYNLQIFVKHYL